MCLVYLEWDAPNPDGAHFASKVLVAFVADVSLRKAKETLLLIGFDTISGQGDIMRMLRNECVMMSKSRLSWTKELLERSQKNSGAQRLGS